MKITIKSLKFDAREQLTAFIDRKVGRLERFCGDKADEVLVTLENLKEGKNARLQIAIPGENLVIERTSDTFENAVTACVDGMKERLTRAKERLEQ